MKIALCFIISYDHILNKEHIWRKWIEPNKDIINVYFYYKDIKKIKDLKTIVKENYHEKIINVVNFTETELDSFFTNRYK